MESGRRHMPGPPPGAQAEQRPWGYFQVLADGRLFKSKTIVVYPGRRLSLQRHLGRDEHWFIVQGRALVTLDTRLIELARGGSVDIARNVFHRVENPGDEDLIFVEVQTGDYFGEDDIERAEDDYGRI